MTLTTRRILCFGDSLTYGYFRFGEGENPYSLRMKKCLQEAVPDLEYDVQTHGYNGYLISEEDMARNFATHLEDMKENLDWTIILGGTNSVIVSNTDSDLAYNVTVKKIKDSLEAMYKKALTQNSNVLALTIPEAARSKKGSREKRDEINEWILNYRSPGYHAFDLEKAIPYHSMSEGDREVYWDDGLHLTAEGYDRMGQSIAEVLIPFLQETRPSA